MSQNIHISGDRFEALRVPIDCEVELRIGPDDPEVRLSAANISMSGMFLRTTELYEPGTVFYVRFRLREDEPPITGKGEVLWYRLRDAGPEQPMGIGIRFLDLDLESKYAISCLVDRYLQLGGIPVDLGSAGFRNTAPRSTDRRAVLSLITTFVAGLAIGVAGSFMWMRSAGDAEPRPVRSPSSAYDTGSSPVAPETEAASSASESEPGPPVVEEVVSGGDLSVAVAAAFQDWVAAWSGKNVERYLELYSEDFVPASGVALSTWKAQRRERLGRPGFIQVEVAELAIDSFADDRFQTTFVQSYASAGYRDRVRKTLEWVRGEGGWKIVSEEVVREPSD